MSVELKEYEDLLRQYTDWVRAKSRIEIVGDWAEITTPFLDRRNDYIQVYVRRIGGSEEYELTDDGYTISDLRMSGCDLDSTQTRRDLLAVTLRGFGVTLGPSQELTARATSEDFAQQKHNLVQAILAVNDLFLTAHPTVHTLFMEDVKNWLWTEQVRYLDKVTIVGHSRLVHHFDFVIPATPGAAGERYVQAISNPNREAAVSLAFKWEDIRTERGPDARAFAILNDGDRSPSGAVTTALRRYEIEPVRYSQRDSVREQLAA